MLLFLTCRMKSLFAIINLKTETQKRRFYVSFAKMLTHETLPQFI